MRLDILFTLDGKMIASVDKTQAADFTAGRQALDDFAGVLKAAGIDIDWTSEVERHTHGPDGEHVHTHGGRAHSHA